MSTTDSIPSFSFVGCQDVCKLLFPSKWIEFKSVVTVFAEDRVLSVTTLWGNSTCHGKTGVLVLLTVKTGSRAQQPKGVI